MGAKTNIGQSLTNDNVGIGIVPVDGTNKLQVAGNSELNGALQVQGNTIISGNVGIGTTSSVTRLTVTTGTDTTFNDGALKVIGDIALNSSNNLNPAINRFSLRARAAGVDGAFDIFDARFSLSRFLIDLNGNVGIGTTSPTQKLEVNGSGKFSSNVTATRHIITSNAMSIGSDFSNNITLYGFTDAKKINFDLGSSANAVIGTSLTQFVFTSKVQVPDGTALGDAVNKSQIDLFVQSSSTGLTEGGTMIINSGNTARYDIAAGFGYIIDGHSNVGLPTAKKVLWNAKISNTTPFLATHDQTHIAIDINGDIYPTVIPLTATERRNYIRLGVLIHLDNATISFIDNQPTVNIEVGGQVQDLLEAFGFRSLSGNRIFPVAANLKIKKEAGTAFKPGANFRNLNTQPHSFILPAQDPITFRYRTQTGAEGSDITDINPAIYDVNGSITAMPATATLATIQRIYVFQDNLIRIQLGQKFFNNLNEAVTGINSDEFITDSDISNNGLYLGAIVMIRGTTALNNLAQAIFVPSSGVSANGSTAAAPLGYTAEDAANKQNNLDVDGTGAKYASIDAVNGAVVKLTGAQTIAGEKTFSSRARILTGNLGSSINLAATAFRVVNIDQGLFMGSRNGAPDFASWIQSSREGFDLTFPLLLNPNGGNVGIKNTTPSSMISYARDLVIGNGSAPAGLTIFSNQGYGAVVFADGITGDSQLRNGEIIYDHASNYMQLVVNRINALKLDSTGVATFASNVTATSSILKNTSAASGNSYISGISIVNDRSGGERASINVFTDATENTSKILFATSDDGLAPTTKLNIAGSGAATFSSSVTATNGFFSLEGRFGTRIKFNNANQFIGDGTMFSTSGTNDFGIRNDLGNIRFAAGSAVPQFTLATSGAASFSSTVMATGGLLLPYNGGISLNEGYVQRKLMWTGYDGVRDNLYLGVAGAYAGSGTEATTPRLTLTTSGATFHSSVTATSFNGGAALTGTPTAPTAAAFTSTTQIATTANVVSSIFAYITSSRYVPSAASSTNLTAITFQLAGYTRVGGFVSATISYSVNVTASNTTSSVTFDLPIAKAAGSENALGIGAGTTELTSGGLAYGTLVRTLANLTQCRLSFLPTGTGVHRGSITIGYLQDDNI